MQLTNYTHNYKNNSEYWLGLKFKQSFTSGPLSGQGNLKLLLTHAEEHNKLNYLFISVYYTKDLAFNINGQLHFLTYYSSKGNELSLL
jgi:hypothetical protein